MRAEYDTRWRSMACQEGKKIGGGGGEKTKRVREETGR